MHHKTIITRYFLQKKGSAIISNKIKASHENQSIGFCSF